MRMGMGVSGSLLLAVSGLLTASDVSAIEGAAAGSDGRVLMQVPTDVEYEYQLAIGDVATGEVIPIGKPALDRLPDLGDPFAAVEFEESVVVSGLATDPVVIGPDGSVSDFVLPGGMRAMPSSLGDGEHYLVANAIYAASTEVLVPLTSLSPDFGDRDIDVEPLAGDWVEIGNDNARVYVRLSDLDTVRSLPQSADHSFIWLRADGQVVWEEDRDGSSALMIAHLSSPETEEVTAREFYSASPFVNLRARVGDYFVAGRSEILLVDPATGATVGNLTVDLDLPPRSNVYSIGDGPLLEVRATEREAELWNVETRELVPLGDGRIAYRDDQWVLWETWDGAAIRVIEVASGIVGDVELSGFELMQDFLGVAVAVGERIVLPGCFGQASVVIDPGTATATSSAPFCSVVPTSDGRFVVGGTSLAHEELGFCSTPMVVEELGVGIAQAFPSGCPLAWLVEP